MNLPDGINSIANVCDVELFTTPGAEPSRPHLFFEIPHGATCEAHYRAVRAMLSADLPEDLIDYFFVNTDVGSTEFSRKVAEIVTQSALQPKSVLVLRCLIPRTFIDTNRVIDADLRSAVAEGLTTAMAEFIRDPSDARTLLGMYRQYHDVAERAYNWICAFGGFAVTSHTYAPKSIRIDSFDEGIGKALRNAYEPEQYARWEVRPAVDLITKDPDGVNLGPKSIVRAIRQAYARIGIEATENASYRLHPISMAYHYSARFSGQVLCIEVARDQLADPFSPFEEMRISDEKVARISEPIAAAFLQELETR